MLPEEWTTEKIFNELARLSLLVATYAAQCEQGMSASQMLAITQQELGMFYTEHRDKVKFMVWEGDNPPDFTVTTARYSPTPQQAPSVLQNGEVETW